MWGDPLIVPSIHEMIRYAHDARVWSYISSNLHALTPEDDEARRLVESSLNELTCSLHGASQETFEAYQPGKNLSEPVEKVRRIVEVRDRLASATPRVRLNFVVTRRNEHEQEAFTKLASEIVASEGGLTMRFDDGVITAERIELRKDSLAVGNVGSFKSTAQS
jgi:MoaA/NifB/PqqE/SkfB family radical SAM enzyme